MKKHLLTKNLILIICIPVGYVVSALLMSSVLQPIQSMYSSNIVTRKEVMLSLLWLFIIVVISGIQSLPSINQSDTANKIRWGCYCFILGMVSFVVNQFM